MTTNGRARRALVAGVLAFAVAGAGGVAGAKKPAAAGAARADVDRAKLPEPGPTPTVALPQPTRFTLPSGAQALVVERHTLPMVAVTVVWAGGSSQDPAGRYGLAGLVADLLDEGTTTRSSLALAEEVEGLGARLGTFATWDAVGVSLISLKRNLAPSLAVLADVLAHPAFPARELERLRSERLTALLQQRDSAAQVASNVFEATLYGEGHRYGHPFLGEEEALRRISREDVLRFARAEMRPQDATVIIVGDVEPTALRSELQHALAIWQRSESDGPWSRTLPQPPAAARYVVVDKPGAQQTELRIGQPGVARSSPDYFPLVVANTLFGGYFAARLNVNLREKHGYTYGAGSSVGFRRDGGPFQIASGVKTDVTAPSVDEALKELRRLCSEPVGEEELRLAKDFQVRTMARRFSSVGAIASELAQTVVYKLPDDFLSTYAANIEAVTAADVARVVKAHLDPAKQTVLVVGDEKVIGPALGKLGLGRVERRDASGRVIGAPPAPRPR